MAASCDSCTTESCYSEKLEGRHDNSQDVDACLKREQSLVKNSNLHLTESSYQPFDESEETAFPFDSSHSSSSSTTSDYWAQSKHGSRKYKLIQEGEILVCRLNHTRTIVSKIMNSKYLRRWEMHHIVLGADHLRSTMISGFMPTSVPYSTMEEVNTVSRWDAGHKFCLRISISDGSILLQAPNAYSRDQWLYSIQWKKQMLRYEKMLLQSRRPEVLIKEIRGLVETAANCPLQDKCVRQTPLDLISRLLLRNCQQHDQNQQIIVALAPLLDSSHPTQEICEFFSKHCQTYPRSPVVIELFTPIVHTILKHNTDFGKFTFMRSFIQDYLLALRAQNNGQQVIKDFVANCHGVGSICPHPRVLPNLVAVALSSVFNLYEQLRSVSSKNLADLNLNQELSFQEKLSCYVVVFEALAEYDDWRPLLASLLQPIPFPDDALCDSYFTKSMMTAIQRLATDPHCEVHRTLLGIREGKEGWIHLYCPGGVACCDDGELFCLILDCLLVCCSKRKMFLQNMMKMLNPCMLLALRDNLPAIKILCCMLEMDMIDCSDIKMQVITTLQSTKSGKLEYVRLCEDQIALCELQQKGGPRKLTLPSRSTDTDLTKLLKSGSFGNLECLSLAFTQVTSNCAKDLIKLPNLRYLNLWSTQFGDFGIQMICDHLHKLQVLNLCETPITDKGISCLSSLKYLRKLNLNSTNLSALTFEGLKEKLPALEYCDIRYTDAW